MKNSIVFLVLLLCVSALYSGNDIVPAEVIEDIAVRNAEVLWGEVTKGEVIPYYYTDGEIVAWQYNFVRGKEFPAKEALLEAYANSRTPVGFEDYSFGMMLIGGRTDMPVFLQYGETLSHEYKLGALLTEMAEEAVGKGYQVERVYYLTTANVWYCVSNNGEKKYIRLLPPAKVLEEAEFFEFAAGFNFFCERADRQQKWAEYASGERELSRDWVYIENHELMPFYPWHYGCGPTAASMLLAWFDYNSINSIYKCSCLVDYHWTELVGDPSNPQYDYNVPNVAYELQNVMETNNAGWTLCRNIVPGILEVCNDYHDYEFEGIAVYTDHDTTWYYNNVVDYTEDGLPIMLWINENHFVTAIGYNTDGDHVALHDPNHEVIINFDKAGIDGSFGIWPEEGEGSSITLISPKGDTRFNQWGPGYSGEVLAGNDIWEIEWEKEGSGYNETVTILYVTSSIDNDLHYVIESTPNTGYYRWHVPNNIDSETCRIWIVLYDSQGTLIGADGSYGDFEIHPGGSLEELTYDNAVTTMTDPDFYWFDHNGTNWKVVGVRSNSVNDNWGLTLFNDTDFSQEIKTSHYYTGNVNLIAIDGNHAPTLDRGLRVAHYENETTSEMAKVEIEGEPDENLSLGCNPQETWPAGDVCDIWDVYLMQGVYSIELDVLSGNADLDLGIFESSPAIYYKNIGEMLTSSTNLGPGQDESISITITQADYYGVCVWALNAESAVFQINIIGPGTWEGNVSTNWNDPANWANGLVPDEDTDVLIPAGVPHFPVIENSDFNLCKNLTIAEDASVVIGNRSLVVNGSASIYGTVEITSSAATARLIIDGHVHWYGTSHLTDTAAGEVRISGNWIADEGAEINLVYSETIFSGNEDSIIQINAEDHVFYKLIIFKGNNHEVVFSSQSDQELETTGFFFVYPDAEFRVLTDAEIIVGGTFAVSLNAKVTFEEGTLNFVNTSAFTPGITSSYKNINVASGASLVIYGDIELESMVIDGSVYANDVELNLSGNWIREAGTFAATNSTVIFNGENNNQYVNENNFNTVILDKGFGGELIISSGDELTCDSFEYNSGTIRVNGGSFTAEDLADVRVMGNYVLDGGSINLHQGTTMFEYVDLDASIEITDGTFNIYGGYPYPSEWALTRGITINISGGVLDFKDNGILISDTAHEVNDIITGGTIRTSGDFKVEREGFNPTRGWIELYGEGTAYCYNNPGSSFYNIRINKGSNSRAEGERDRFNRVIFNYDTTIESVLRVDSGFIQIDDISITMNELEISGGLQMDSEDDRINVNNNVSWYQGSDATVYDGEIHVGGDWSFYTETDCQLEPGNVVYFEGTDISHIYSWSETACFGEVQIDKTSNVCVVYHLSQSPVQISGDLKVLTDNTFVLNFNSLNVSGMIDLYTGSEFIMNTGSDVSTPDLYMQGSLTMYDGDITIADDFVQYASGDLTINNGNFIIDNPSDGSHVSFNGDVTLNGGILQITNNGVQFGEDSNFEQNGGTLKTGWGLRALTSGVFQQNSGTTEFIGSLNCQINCAANNWFNDVIINKTGYPGDCLMQDVMQINGDLSIQDGKLSTGSNQLTIYGSLNIGEEGILDADEGLILVGENWTNEHGDAGFVETNSSVRFFDSNPGDISNDETFYDLTIFKDGGTNYHMTIPIGNTLHVLHNFYISDGTLLMLLNSTLDVDHDVVIADGAGLNCYYLDANTTVNIGGDFVDNNDDVDFMTSFNCGLSTVTFDGATNQVVSSNREFLEFENLVINSTGEDFIVESNIRILGDLDIVNGCWNNANVGMTHYLCGSVSICEDGWLDNLGTVVFYGSTEASYEVFGGGVTFHNVIIDKDPAGDRTDNRSPDITLGSNLYLLQDGDLTIESGSLISGGAEISCSGNVTINDGTLYLEPATRLRVGNECALNVNDGGSLICDGSELYPVDVTCYDDGHYHEVNINSGGTISAEYTTFQYMSENGVYVTFYGTVDEDYAFNYCTFQNSVSGGYLLRLRNDQELTSYNAVFPDNTWGSSYNVYKNINQGNIEFINATGGFAGESHDYDPYNRLNWTTIIPPEITVIADDPMAFGDVIIGQMGSQGIDIQNTGGMALTGTITTPEGYNVSFWSRDDERRTGNRNLLPFTVEAYSIHTYRLDFQPEEVGNFDGQIVITHNAGGDDEIVNVTGNGLPVPPPACEIWTDEFAFGDVFLGETEAIWFDINNSGGSTLEGSMNTPDGYHVEEVVWRNPAAPEEKHRETVNGRNELSFELEAGWMMSFYLYFEPEELQEYNGTLTITHNAPEGETLIDCTGRGVEAILRYLPSFITSVLTPGETETLPLTLGNEGNLDIHYLVYIAYEGVNNTIIEEGFEGGFPPTGWSIDPAGWNGWMQSNEYAWAGDYSAQINSMDGDDARLITPWFTATDDCLLRYWIKGYCDFWDEFAAGEFHIEMTTNGNDWNDVFSCSQEILPEDWEQWGLSLGDYAGQTVRLAYHVTSNLMSRGVNIDEVKITGEANPTYSWLLLNGETNLAGNIAAGAPDQEISVSFNSTGVPDGAYYAYIYLLSNDTSNPLINIPAAFNVGVYEMTVTPSSLDFGTIEAGTEVTQQFTLDNTGSLELDGEITMPEGYSVAEPMPGMRNDVLIYHLFPGNSFTYNATFAPETYGNFDGDITISNIWTDAVELLPVTGSGLAAGMNLNQESLGFEQQPGGMGSDILTLGNEGNLSLEYSAAVAYMRESRDILVSEGFEGVFPPLGWTNQNLGMGSNWGLDSFNPHSGMFCTFADPYMTVDARLISPQFNATPDCQLSYYIRTYNMPSMGGSFGVEVSLDGANWTFLEEIDLTTLSDTYQQRTLSLGAYAGSSIMVAFRMYDNNNYFSAGVLLDDVEISGSQALPVEWLTLNGESSIAGEIETGGSIDIEVGYDTEDLTEGYYLADIVINSNDPTMPQQMLMVELTVGYPHISVSPDSLDFWDTAIGGEAWQMFHIENQGDLTLTGEIAVPSGFTVQLDTLNTFREGRSGRNRTTYPFEIDASGFQNYFLIFSPEMAQSYNGELVISHNAPESEIQIQLTALGCGVPLVTTAEITEITDYDATGGGNVLHDGNDIVSTRGICWNETGEPAIEMDTFTEDGSGLGEYVSAINGLLPGTTYYVRAYAVNNYGCGYGEEVTFMTSGPLINLSVESLPDFGAVAAGYFSEEASYTVSGNGLVDDLVIFAPTGFQVAIDNMRTLEFTEMLFLEQVNGVVPETTIYVRFSPAMVGDYDDFIVHYTMNAQTKRVHVQGSGAILPALNVSVTELPDFGEIPVDQISQPETYSVSGFDLLGELVITAPAGFEISLTPDRGLLSRSGSR
ncbi:MAG: choice-of-anchor D domain-containing protein, partial [Candidatus Cloacimonetes bacterium]|nr:choice-of-anchor D domain-containing protein [Candidatus Cloacimonadota bacterium]